jgi:hypothetical protein
MSKMTSVSFKVHTPNLLNEILTNKGMGIMVRPIQAFANILAQVAIRASQLNDPELNDLMCRLTLYSISDPHASEFDQKAIDEIAKIAKEIREKR